MTTIDTHILLPRIKGFCKDCAQYRNLADTQSDTSYGHCSYWKHLVEAQDYCAYMKPATPRTETA